MCEIKTSVVFLCEFITKIWKTCSQKVLSRGVDLGAAGVHGGMTSDAWNTDQTATTGTFRHVWKPM